MSLHFTKMHGLGNDFVILDGRHLDLGLSPAMIRSMADRHTGIGFDQLLVVNSARDPSCAYYYSIWNADGSPAAQCGNGVRCVASWLHRQGALAMHATMRLESPSGVMVVYVIDSQSVMVNMGEPCFAPINIPFESILEDDYYKLEIENQMLNIGAVSMGNPHAVLQVDAMDTSELIRVAPLVTNHPRFPMGVNACFVQQLDRTHLHLRVHERGAGWTQACGSGACATMAVLRRRGKVEDCVQVTLPGGTLQIDWTGPGQALYMTGPATFVFHGQWA